MNDYPLFSVVDELKKALPLPQLMEMLGQGQLAKKASKCIFHDDKRASFSTFQKSDNWFWKCHAGCGSGDEISFLEHLKGLNAGEAIKEYARLAGINPPSASNEDSTPNLGHIMSHALRRLIENDRHKSICEWRGFSEPFILWLNKKRHLIGLRKDDQVVFPVYERPHKLIGMHYRCQDASWRYYPKGTTAQPLFLEDPDDAQEAWVFESQWDAMAIMDALKWHEAPRPGIAIISTRGAANAKLVHKLFPPQCKVIAWPQNDPRKEENTLSPAEKWTADLAANVAGPLFIAKTPPEHKDPNDWLLKGGGYEDFNTAIEQSETYAQKQSRTLITSPDELVPEDNEEEVEPSPFPTQLLPKVLTDLVLSCSKNLGVPEALPAISALGVCSASLGRGLIIKNGPNWITRPNLYLLGSARSGSGKSETAKLVAKPMLLYQQEKLNQWRNKVSPKIEADVAINKVRITKLENETKGNIDPTRMQKIHDELKGYLRKKRELLQRRHEPTFIVADVTSEKLALVLSLNSEVMFSLSPDARQVLEIVSGRYTANNSTDETIYLQSFSGDFLKVDRIGRAEPVILNQPCLSVLWLVQPDALYRLFESESLFQSGFLARFLFANTHAKARKFDCVRQKEDESDLSAHWEWNELIRSLLNQFHQSKEPFEIEAMPEAEKCLNEYRNRVIDRTDSELADVEIFATRWAEQAWRLSLVLYAAENGADSIKVPLSLDLVQKAVQLMDWFADQQLQILTKGRRKAAEKQEDEIDHLFERVKKKKDKDFITRRDVQRSGIADSKEQAQAILSRLVKEGILIEEEHQNPTGGRPTIQYRKVTKPVSVRG